MEIEAIIQEIGEFGKFQLRNYILVCLPVIYAAANSLAYVFTSRSPKYRCIVPECDSEWHSEYSQEWIKNVLPGTISSTSPDHFIPEECYRFEFSHNETFFRNGTCLTYLFSRKKIKCNQWIFDGYDKTIVNEWPEELACSENKWKLASVGSIHYIGILIGTAFFGFIADHFGRKNIFVIAIVLMSVTGIGHSVSKSYVTYMIYAFLNAFATAGVYPLAFVLGVEMVGKSKRETSGIVLNYFYTIGEALVGIIAWLDGNWRALQFWVSTPPILFAVYYWILPESIRWLIANEAYSKAYKIVKKAAKENQRELSENLQKQFDEKCHGKENSAVDRRPKDESETNYEAATYIKVLKSKILMIRSLCLCYIWGTNAFVFYGLSLNSINLSGNIYLNFILGCVIEIPGNTLAWISMNKFGRRHSMTASFLVCGICCIVGGFMSDRSTWLQIILFLLGKMAITSSFTIVFVYTAEMLPTKVRGGCLGLFSTIARFASLLAPFVPLLKRIHDFLPLFVFGLIAFVAGTLSFLLPETLGTTLPNTIREAEFIGLKEGAVNGGFEAE